eukprot:gb/GECH01008367.1/.p1 GENE.gb/GECH01008367.1/~~gb/GECH01008367.1/.p1  ORF type:complete len:260 (+),score=81.04 gb/GECH01008367.1/:1-780(+)
MKETSVFITGASSGIGQAIAQELVAAYASSSGVLLSIFLQGRNESRLQETQDLCSKTYQEHQTQDNKEPNELKIHKLTGDVTQEEDVEKWIKFVAENTKDGMIDILINNAGILYIKDAYEADFDEWERVIDVNVIGVMRLTKAFLSRIKNNSGAIVTIASRASKRTFPKYASYCASKHAVLGFMNSVFEDVRENGIKVCTLLPSFVNTPMVAPQHDRLDPERMIQPMDIAKTVRFVIDFPSTACPTEIFVLPQKLPNRT